MISHAMPSHVKQCQIQISSSIIESKANEILPSSRIALGNRRQSDEANDQNGEAELAIHVVKKVLRCLFS